MVDYHAGVLGSNLPKDFSLWNYFRSQISLTWQASVGVASLVFRVYGWDILSEVGFEHTTETCHLNIHEKYFHLDLDTLDLIPM